MRIFLVFLALAITLAAPFLLRPEEDLLAESDDVLVIVTPHNEAIRHEFARAFAEHYLEKTGLTVRIDWRTPGGTSEITRFLQSEYLAAFQFYWTQKLGREWNTESATGWTNAASASMAREAFLNSNVSSGIDLFFGGGAYDFGVQAKLGTFVPCSVFNTHPEWFGADGIPQQLSGEKFYDEEHRWAGACLSAFGIVYNLDALERLDVPPPLDSWDSLADPRLSGNVALADPTKSGSATKAFEMLIQQRMQRAVRRGESVAQGWNEAMRLILQIAANARYFTDSASKIPIDVALGDAAAGMCIDFYGRFQSEAVREAGGRSRLEYVTPEGGSSIGVDPIGLLRGAPHPELANEFITFVLSIEGQKLWNFRVGTPGGPVKFSLRRLPVRPAMYQPKYRQYFADPGVQPYEAARKFVYHPEWTGPLFNAIRFIVKVAALNPHAELRDAWATIKERGFPEDALQTLLDVSAIDYESAMEEIRPALKSGDPLDEVRLEKRLTQHFAGQYRRARK